MSGTTKRVLCVEDHKDTCELITVVLADYSVTSADTKKAALEHIGKSKFDLILLDYHLPDGTGEEICREIRAKDPHTPVLFVTGSKNFSETTARALGAQGALTKTSANFTTDLLSRAIALT